MNDTKDLFFNASKDFVIISQNNNNVFGIHFYITELLIKIWQND